MGAAKSDLLQGTLDMLILQIAALGPVHGYAIAQRLQQISRDTLQVQQGSLYPALHRLEARGWLKSEWDRTETGRDAKFYVLTKAGRRQLDDERAHWERIAQAIALVLRTAE
jgi:PadR family transcriptional regulator, regulatory protein PadR